MRVLLNGKKVGEIDSRRKLATEDPKLRKAYDRIEAEGIVTLGPGKVMTEEICSTTEKVTPLKEASVSVLTRELHRFGYDLIV